MKRKKTSPSHPGGREHSQAETPALRRFKTLYGKPKTLSDRYDECREADIADLLRKPEAELGWDDFNMLFRVGVASASYEEGVYFLPAAFAFLRRHPNPDTVHCIADVIWFVSEHAARLEQHGFLEACREQVLALLHERTTQFVVVHWDREKNRQMGFDRDHLDYVEDSQLVCDTLEALLRFDQLRTWAEEFVAALGRSRDDPLQSAWYLEIVGDGRHWPFLRREACPAEPSRAEEALFTAHPDLGGLWAEFKLRGFVRDCPAELSPDAAQLQRHAEVIRRSGGLFQQHPTYWAKVFGQLGVSSESSAGASQTPPRDET